MACRQRDAQLFAIVWALKYIERSSGLTLLLRVLRRALPSLVTVVAVFFVVLLISATLAYLFEREAQPQAFRSIPHALWWAIVTLSTTGYGDLVPMTIWGRALRGLGDGQRHRHFCAVGRPIATAFAEECSAGIS